MSSKDNLFGRALVVILVIANVCTVASFALAVYLNFFQ